MALHMMRNVFCLIGLLNIVSSNVLEASSLSLQLNKTTWCDNFIIFDDCSEEEWEGVLKDMFSPDDTCPESLRYIELADDGSNQLQVSASGTDTNCSSTWGRKFNDTTTVNPILSPSSLNQNSTCIKTTSFMSKVPPTDPLYQDAQNGALNFTLKLGTVDGHKVNMWNGVYNGQGGDMNGVYVPPSDCDNFWIYFNRV